MIKALKRSLPRAWSGACMIFVCCFFAITFGMDLDLSDKLGGNWTAGLSY